MTIVNETSYLSVSKSSVHLDSESTDNIGANDDCWSNDNDRQVLQEDGGFLSHGHEIVLMENFVHVVGTDSHAEKRQQPEIVQGNPKDRTRQITEGSNLTQLVDGEGYG